MAAGKWLIGHRVGDTTGMDEGAEYREPTLAQVLERIGPALADVVTAPQGTGVAVSGPAIHDLLDPAPPRPGSLVLLVGVEPAAPAAAAAIGRLAGASAVVIRGATADVALLAPAAAAAGVALVALHTALSWSHLHMQAERAMEAADRVSIPPGGAAGDLGSAPVGDLPALVNAIAAVLDRPVAIIDTQWQLLAYSTVAGQWIDDLQREVILTRVVPVANAPQQTRRLLLTGVHAMHFTTDTADGPIWRIGAGIRAGREPLGMMWVLEGHERLPDDRLVLVEEYARVAGAHLARARTARTAARRLRAELVGQALDGNPEEPGRARAACRRLGLDPDAGIAVVAIGALRPTPGATGMDETVLDAVAAYLDAYRRAAACVLRDDTVYCLMPAPEQRSWAGLRDVVDGLVRSVGGGRRLVAAVGGRVTGVEALGRSRRHADLALAALRADPRADPRVDLRTDLRTDLRGRAAVTIEEMRPAAALHELRTLLAEHPELLVHEPHGDLDDAAASVLAHIDAHGDVRAAAGVLGVHPNTLRYRVRRLAEAGTDLADPATRLMAWIRLALTQR